jgi:hypothetical protein
MWQSNWATSVVALVCHMGQPNRRQMGKGCKSTGFAMVCPIGAQRILALGPTSAPIGHVYGVWDWCAFPVVADSDYMIFLKDTVERSYIVDCCTIGLVAFPIVADSDYTVFL